MATATLGTAATNTLTALALNLLFLRPNLYTLLFLAVSAAVGLIPAIVIAERDRLVQQLGFSEERFRNLIAKPGHDGARATAQLRQAGAETHQHGGDHSHGHQNSILPSQAGCGGGGRGVTIARPRAMMAATMAPANEPLPHGPG